MKEILDKGMKYAKKKISKIKKFASDRKAKQSGKFKQIEENKVESTKKPLGDVVESKPNKKLRPAVKVAGGTGAGLIGVAALSDDSDESHEDRIARKLKEGKPLTEAERKYKKLYMD